MASCGLNIHHQPEESKAAGIIFQDFIRGYGPLDSKTVYQAAVMTGLHLLVWDAFCLVDWCHEDAPRACACDMIARGYQWDKQWCVNLSYGGCSRSSRFLGSIRFTNQLGRLLYLMGRILWLS
jgi:hypothetical protein